MAITGTQKISGSEIIRYGVLILLALGLSTLPTHEVSDKFLGAAAIFLIVGTFVLNANNKSETSSIILLSRVVLPFFLWISASCLLLGGGLGEIDNYSRWLLSLLVIFLLFKFVLVDLRQATRFFVGTSMLVSVFSFTVAITQYFILNSPEYGGRAFGNTNPLPFSEMVLTSAGIVALSIWFSKIPKRTLLFGFWICLTIFVTVLTGTRGTYIAIFPLLISLIVFSWLKKETGIKLLTLASLFLLATLVLAFNPRTNSAMEQLSASSAGEYVGSVGIRLEMWENALVLIQERPIIGHGVQDLSIIASRHPDITNWTYDHLHNQFLDIWVKAGAIGFVLLLIIHFWPMIRGLKLVISEEKPMVGFVAIWISGSFMTYGLTQTYMAHSNTSLFFSFFLIFSFGLLQKTSSGEN